MPGSKSSGRSCNSLCIHRYRQGAKTRRTLTTLSFGAADGLLEEVRILLKRLPVQTFPAGRLPLCFLDFAKLSICAGKEVTGLLQLRSQPGRCAKFFLRLGVVPLTIRNSPELEAGECMVGIQGHGSGQPLASLAVLAPTSQNSADGKYCRKVGRFVFGGLAPLRQSCVLFPLLQIRASQIEASFALPGREIQHPPERLLGGSKLVKRQLGLTDHELHFRAAATFGQHARQKRFSLFAAPCL